MGDALEIEFLEIEPQPTAFSAILPGLGFLRDTMTTPFLVHWKSVEGWATSEQIPGIRLPAPIPREHLPAEMLLPGLLIDATPVGFLPRHID